MKGCKGIEFVKVQKCKGIVQKPDVQVVAKSKRKSDAQAEVRCSCGSQFKWKLGAEVCEAVVWKCEASPVEVRCPSGSESKWRAGYRSVRRRGSV